MYNMVFESYDGKKFVFGVNGGNVFDADVGDGVSVDLGKSQGFSQIGETVETKKISGRNISVRGVIFLNVPNTKKVMRNVIAPLSSGRLVVNGTHYIAVHVKNAPTFSPVKNDGRFTIQFFAPFPFFYSVKEKDYFIGGITKKFKFPVNYATPHYFGIRSDQKYAKIFNDGDVFAPFSLKITASGSCKNITITNLKTFSFLRLNGELAPGDSVSIYRDKNGVLRAERESGEKVEDIISWVDEDSTLFDLSTGDNLISASDDYNGSGFTARISFRPAVGAVYEN